MNSQTDYGKSSGEPPDAGSRRNAPIFWTTVFWSIGLLLLSALVGTFLIVVAPYAMMLIVPEREFIGMVFASLPYLILFLWSAGVLAAHRRHRSFKIDGALVAVGGVLWITSPIWMYLVAILAVGGWNVGK